MSPRKAILVVETDGLEALGPGLLHDLIAALCRGQASLGALDPDARGRVELDFHPGGVVMNLRVAVVHLGRNGAPADHGVAGGPQGFPNKPRIARPR